MAVLTKAIHYKLLANWPLKVTGKSKTIKIFSEKSKLAEHIQIKIITYLSLLE
jgi:hypothetical protein